MLDERTNAPTKCSHGVFKNLALCCGDFLRGTFLLNALSPCEITGATFLFSVSIRSSNSARQSNVSNPLLRRWQSLDGGNKNKTCLVVFCQNVLNSFPILLSVDVQSRFSFATESIASGIISPGGPAIEKS